MTPAQTLHILHTVDTSFRSKAVEFPDIGFPDSIDFEGYCWNIECMDKGMLDGDDMDNVRRRPR
jgi:hypothetical protein